jgi:hypothetical protein
VTMEITPFWVAIPRTLETSRRLGGVYHLHFRSREVRKQEIGRICRPINRWLLMVSFLASYITLKIEGVCSFEFSGCLLATRRHNLEDRSLQIFLRFHSPSW